MNLPVRFFTHCLRRYFLSWKFLFVFCCLFAMVALLNVSYIRNRIMGATSQMSIVKVRTTTLRTPIRLSPEKLREIALRKRNNSLTAGKSRAQLKLKVLRQKMERLRKLKPDPGVESVEMNETAHVNYNAHIFYYAWYESESVDGGWQHWNHAYLENWRKNDPRVYPTGRHVPPDDIGSNFYPKLGCYSSRDPAVIERHMKQIRDVGIGVIVVSWYPPGMSDGDTRSPDDVFLQLLNAADKHALKISPHIEPYRGRNPTNFREHLKYFTTTYGNHSALYKMKRGDRDLIVYYVYDSYRTPAAEWKELLSVGGNITVRGTVNDGIFLGLLVESNHKHEIKKARFDGFYTYFATNGFSHGSTWKNWKTLAALARHQNLIFVPSIGPGYVDTRIRPWNGVNTRHRSHGKYYEVGWRAAISAGATHVSVTSFNEWHEGTQIEPAVAKSIGNFTYLDYEPEGSDYYLKMTKYWVDKFTKSRVSVS